MGARNRGTLRCCTAGGPGGRRLDICIAYERRAGTSYLRLSADRRLVRSIVVLPHRPEIWALGVMQ